LSLLAWPADDRPWGIPDRAKATGNDAEIALAFAEAFRLLNNRISVFTSLPIAKLDRRSLQAHLNNIGAMERPDRKSHAAA
jgi:arsenate reductase